MTTEGATKPVISIFANRDRVFVMRRDDGWALLVRLDDFPSDEAAWSGALDWRNGGRNPYLLLRNLP